MENGQPASGYKSGDDHVEPGQDGVGSVDLEVLAHEHSHIEERRLRDLPVRFGNLARFPLLALIRLYQMTFSRVLPADTCRFYPSCSHYGYQAVYKYGVIKGSLMAAWRVLRCNPFSKGGFDPVP